MTLRDSGLERPKSATETKSSNPVPSAGESMTRLSPILPSGCRWRRAGPLDLFQDTPGLVLGRRSSLRGHPLRPRRQVLAADRPVARALQHRQVVEIVGRDRLPGVLAPIHRCRVRKPGTRCRSGMCSLSHQSLNSSAATHEKSIAAISAPFAPWPSLLLWQSAHSYAKQAERCISRVRVSRRRPRADRLPGPSRRRSPSSRGLRGRRLSNGAPARCTASCRPHSRGHDHGHERLLRGLPSLGVRIGKNQALVFDHLQIDPSVGELVALGIAHDDQVGADGPHVQLGNGRGVGRRREPLFQNLGLGPCPKQLFARGVDEPRQDKLAVAGGGVDADWCSPLGRSLHGRCRP
jgi:hypothetical protein